MIPEQHKDAIISSGISFMRTITEAYGADEGMKLWDSISSVLSPDVKGEIFFALITGNHSLEVVIRKIPQGGMTNYVEIIKEIRSITSWGLKEAKDCADRARDGIPQIIPVSDKSKVPAIRIDLTRLGCLL